MKSLKFFTLFKSFTFNKTNAVNKIRRFSRKTRLGVTFSNMFTSHFLEEERLVRALDEFDDGYINSFLNLRKLFVTAHFRRNLNHLSGGIAFANNLLSLQSQNWKNEPQSNPLLLQTNHTFSSLGSQARVFSVNLSPSATLRTHIDLASLSSVSSWPLTLLKQDQTIFDCQTINFTGLRPFYGDCVFAQPFLKNFFGYKTMMLTAKTINSCISVFERNNSFKPIGTNHNIGSLTIIKQQLSLILLSKLQLHSRIAAPVEYSVLLFNLPRSCFLVPRFYSLVLSRFEPAHTLQLFFQLRKIKSLFFIKNKLLNWVDLNLARLNLLLPAQIFFEKLIFQLYNLVYLNSAELSNTSGWKFTQAFLKRKRRFRRKAISYLLSPCISFASADYAHSALSFSFSNLYFFVHTRSRRTKEKFFAMRYKFANLHLYYWTLKRHFESKALPNMSFYAFTPPPTTKHTFSPLFSLQAHNAIETIPSLDSCAESLYLDALLSWDAILMKFSAGHSRDYFKFLNFEGEKNASSFASSIFGTLNSYKQVRPHVLKGFNDTFFDKLSSTFLKSRSFSLLSTSTPAKLSSIELVTSAYNTVSPLNLVEYGVSSHFNCFAQLTEIFNKNEGSLYFEVDSTVPEFLWLHQKETTALFSLEHDYFFNAVRLYVYNFNEF